MNATARNLKISPRKMRGVANLIRGKRVNDAMAMLSSAPKKAAGLLQKLLVSAVANAEQAGNKDIDGLVVKLCYIDNGPIVKRIMPRSMGRANRIQHRSSHATIVLN